MGRETIGILTDFGTKAGYVASMKGVILSTCGDMQCTIIDLSHDISPQGIVEAAFFLDNCCLLFPDNFIFLVVVDPGVGTSRRIACIETARKHHVFIAPDNGVLDLVVKEQGIARAFAVENPAFWRETRSHVFHGRDIMAPVAAHVARGVSLDALGPVIDPSTLVPLSLPPPARSHPGASIDGAVLYVDSFGNIITNITEDDFTALGTMLHDALVVRTGEIEVTASHELCYAAVPPGRVVCLMNSENRFEISVNQGRAAALFPGVGAGTRVVVCHGV